MFRIFFRIAAGILCLVQVAAGVSLFLMYQGVWNKFCFLALAVMGILFGVYAVRGPRH